jgi:microcystin-dependent protein
MACLALKGSYVGLAPVDVDNMRDTIGLNPATSPGDLMTWDGNNWVAQQPVVQNFNFDNMQPWQGVHFIISLQGFMPTANSADPFMGEIVLFGGNFAPNGWALCDGQILPIASYPDLFSILGTIYGGDGSVTFALPDLRGRVAVHPGSGPGLTPRSLGEKSGIERHVVP